MSEKFADGRTASAMEGFRGDTWRQFGCFSWKLALRGLLLRPGYRALASLRLCQGAAASTGFLRRPLMLGARALHRIACRSAGLELPWKTSTAPGLAITHGWGTVINHGAVIGRNVTLFHGVTLGWGETILDDGSRAGGGNPVIEDDVWIGPHAVVAGPVTVGRGSRLGAGTCLFQSVPPQSVVVGNPGRVAKSGCPPDVVNRYEPGESPDESR